MHFNIKIILKNNGFDKEVNQKNIYQNLYTSLKNAIINRHLETNLKLPPTRVLAKDLGISRSTVLKAYNLLALEKYVKSIKGSGHYVLSTKNKKILLKINSIAANNKYPEISKKGKSFKKNIYINNKESNRGIAFRPGLPPLDIFPVHKWKNLLDSYWREIKPSELSYSNSIGLPSLRQNIAGYLKLYRNINCSSEQVIITSGSLHSLYLISNILLNKKDEVVIENPTYPHAYALFDSLNANINKVNVDNQGICVNKIKSKKPKFAYINPSQYPLGIKMSLERRNELIKWASKKSTFIVEDDYDHEFSNWEKPISSIFSLDNEHRTIYMGTFNKLLHPSLRLAYIIVPHYLIDAIIALCQQSSRFVSPSIQKTMSLFIEKDFLNKHLRNVIEVSKERKDIFISHFNKYLEDNIELNTNTSSLHIVGRIRNNKSDLQISEHLNKNEIITHPLSNYFIKGKQNGLVMGYASVNKKVIKETIKKFYDSYSKIN